MAARRTPALLFFSIVLSVISHVALAQPCRDSGNTEVAAPETVTIKAVGDLVFGNDWPTSSYPPGFENDVRTRLRQVIGPADVLFGNLEGALTTHDVSNKNPNARTVYAFRMPPHFATLMRDIGFNAIAIANNHTFDFGQIGYNDTIAHLAKADVIVVGEPDKIAMQTVNGVRIAWIGFSHLYRHNHINDLAKLTELVQRARALADLVIVSMQAGAEGSEALKVRDVEEKFLGENRGNTFAFARRAIDAGADLVLGHGPHVVRGMECYKGKLIAYSLGNFVGYGALSIRRAAAISMVLEVKLSKDRRTLDFDAIPVKFNEQHLPEPDETALARYLINDLSQLAPLNGSVKLAVDDKGHPAYRRWLTSSELIKILNE